MAIELLEGEVELRRVKESDIGWVTEQVIVDRGQGAEIVEVQRRDHPVETGQRWVYDRCGDNFDKHPENHEWVLVGLGTTTETTPVEPEPEPTPAEPTVEPAKTGGRKWLRVTRS